MDPNPDRYWNLCGSTPHNTTGKNPNSPCGSGSRERQSRVRPRCRQEWWIPTRDWCRAPSPRWSRRGSAAGRPARTCRRWRGRGSLTEPRRGCASRRPGRSPRPLLYEACHKSVAHPDPGSGAFLALDSGSGSGMKNADHISDSLKKIFGG